MHKKGTLFLKKMKQRASLFVSPMFVNMIVIGTNFRFQKKITNFAERSSVFLLSQQNGSFQIDTHFRPDRIIAQFLKNSTVFRVSM